MEFKYTGYSKTGSKEKGLISASDKTEALRQLKNRQIRVRSISSSSGISFFRSIPIKDLSAFTRQFSTLISANLPIDESLLVLEEQTANKRLKATCESVLKEVRSGSSLADALSKHPHTFNRLYCGMVHAGESAGVLGTVLNRLAEYLERIDKIQRKIRGALAYPAVVLGIAAIAITALVLFVVPVFSEMFADMDRPLPLVTKIVLGVSSTLSHNLIWALLAGLLIYLGIRRYLASPKGKLRYSGLSLKMPIIGTLLLKGAVSRFSRTLSTLLHGGIPLLDALRIAQYSADNLTIEQSIEAAIKAVEVGESFARPLGESGIFPTLMVRMVAVGERTGNLKEMLSKVADYYEEEINGTVDTMMSVLEPVIILFLGIVIGFVLVAMYLPMFDMVTEVKG